MNFIESQLCPVCKTKFVPAPMHVYTDARYNDVVSSPGTNTRTRIFVCSWHCCQESKRLAEQQTVNRKANKLTKADIKSDVIRGLRHEMQDTTKTKDT